MADYLPLFRSNYFAVKDVDAFDAFCGRFNLQHITNDQGLHGFMTEEGGLPSYASDFDGIAEPEDADFLAELAPHLAEGHVAVCMEIGFEKMRYLTGLAWAVNSKGQIRDISLGEIYDRASELGEHITECIY